MTDRRSDTPTPRVVKNTPEARQGTTGHNVRYVLVIGTPAVVILFAAIYGYFFR